MKNNDLLLLLLLVLHINLINWNDCHAEDHFAAGSFEGPSLWYGKLPHQHFWVVVAMLDVFAAAVVADADAEVDVDADADYCLLILISVVWSLRDFAVPHASDGRFDVAVVVAVSELVLTRCRAHLLLLALMMLY